MKKVEKGEFGYLAYKKSRNMIKTIIAFAVVLVIFIIGFIIWKSKNNYLTMLAVVLVLPAAKFAVSYFVLIPHKNCDEELKRILTADYELCCALLTMLFREDHFAKYGCFENRCEKGDVQKIIDRMIFLLEQKEENIKKRLAGSTAKYIIFKDDEENTESKPGI